jgi:hypothetical protein
VSFLHHGAEYSNTTKGRSPFDVAAKALGFFCAQHWKGPRPARNTLLDVNFSAISSGIAGWPGD